MGVLINRAGGKARKYITRCIGFSANNAPSVVMASAMAAPTQKFWFDTSNAASGFVDAIIFATFLPVPTGTVDLVMTTV